MENSRNGTHPIGYCAGWQEHNLENLLTKVDETTAHLILADQEKRKIFISYYHHDGHSSYKDACLCYKQYLLDNTLLLGLKLVDELRHCLVCGTFTDGYARLRDEHMTQWTLCQDHMKREFIENIFEVFETFQS